MNIKSITSALLVLAMLAGATACTKRDETAIGPAQQAGAAIDNAGNKVADKLHENIDKANAVSKNVADAAQAQRDEIEKATKGAAQDASKGLSHATEEVGKKVERAGEKIQEAAK